MSFLYTHAFDVLSTILSSAYPPVHQAQHIFPIHCKSIQLQILWYLVLIPIFWQIQRLLGSQNFVAYP